jgi:hypothetical protein
MHLPLDLTVTPDLREPSFDGIIVWQSGLARGFHLLSLVRHLAPQPAWRVELLPPSYHNYSCKKEWKNETYHTTRGGFYR